MSMVGLLGNGGAVDREWTSMTHPLVSDMESSVLALAELTREEADSGVPALIRLRNWTSNILETVFSSSEIKSYLILFIRVVQRPAASLLPVWVVWMGQHVPIVKLGQFAHLRVVR